MGVTRDGKSLLGGGRAGGASLGLHFVVLLCAFLSAEEVDVVGIAIFFREAAVVRLHIPTSYIPICVSRLILVVSVSPLRPRGYAPPPPLRPHGAPPCNQPETGIAKKNASSI